MTNSAQGPSFCDYFRSFYYTVENTYYPPVDLSEEALRAKRHLADDASIPEFVKNTKVQAILSQPRTFDMEKTTQQCAVLKNHGLTAHTHNGKDVCLCSISKEDETVVHAHPCTFFSMTSDRGDYPRFTTEDLLLELELHDCIERASEDNQFEVCTPEDELIPLANHAQETEVSKKYCILHDSNFVSLSRAETVDKIKKMTRDQQTALATKLCFLIQTVGLANFDLDRFKLDSDDRICIETFPWGVLVAKQSAVPKGESIEKCARIGLSQFVKDVKKTFGTATEQGGAFRAYIETVHAEAIRPKYSKGKIALSVLSLGLLPLIYAIISLVQVRAIQNRCQSLNQYEQPGKKLTSAEQTDRVQKIIDLTYSIFSMTEGVPFRHGQSILDKAIEKSQLHLLA